MARPYRIAANSPWHWAGRIALVVVPVAFLLFRVLGNWSTSGIGLLADAIIIAIAVSGVNLITGYTGQLSIGHAAFFALGAYTALMLVEGKVTTPFVEDNTWTAGWTIPVAALVCFVVGALVGLPALRLKGIYLALVTLVFVEAVRALLKYEKFAGVTGGATGIKSSKYIPPTWTGLDGRRDINTWMLYLSIFLLLLITFLVAGLLRSRIGRAMIATRDNETAASVMGVNLSVIKTVVFGLSGAITGVAGALFGLKLGLVDADVPQFGLLGAITFLVAMVVGGAAQTWGPLVGALFYTFVNDFARSVGEDPDGTPIIGWVVGEDTTLNGLGGVTFGVLLILFARFAPFGAVGTFRIARSKVVVVLPSPPDIDGPAAESTVPGGPVAATVASGAPEESSSDDASGTSA